MTKKLNPQIISRKQWWKILELSDRQELLAERKTDVIETLKLGIADEIIPQIWNFLAETNNLKFHFQEIDYKETKRQQSDYEEVIRKDLFSKLPDSVGDKEDFRKMLFNILKVYSLVNVEINYCSGMNLIAQAILYNLIPQDKEFEIVYDPEEIEEQCFWIFYYIMEIQDWKIFYGTQKNKCLQILNKFDLSFQETFPKLHKKLKVGKVEAKFFFIPHFYTLLMNSCPLSHSQKIITNFLISGYDAIQEIIFNNLRIVEQEILEIQSPQQFIPIIQQLLSYVQENQLEQDL